MARTRAAIVAEDAPARALEEISAKGMGMTAVVDAQRKLVGIFTDGDLRRLIRTPRRRSIPTLTVADG